MFAILIVFVSVSAVELAVVDVVVRPWPHIRVPLLILGIWGLVYMLGMLFGMLTRPHAVGRDGLRVRNGPEVDIALPWADIHEVVARKHVVQEKQPKVIIDDTGRATLHLRMQNETNIEVRLARPVTVRLPGSREKVIRSICTPTTRKPSWPRCDGTNRPKRSWESGRAALDRARVDHRGGAPPSTPRPRGGRRESPATCTTGERR